MFFYIGVHDTGADDNATVMRIQGPTPTVIEVQEA
jgi:hypothetical protein